MVPDANGMESDRSRRAALPAPFRVEAAARRATTKSRTKPAVNLSGCAKPRLAAPGRARSTRPTAILRLVESKGGARMSGGCVLVSGATGLVGRRLVPKLVGRFETVRVLSRSARSGAATPGIESRSWDGIDPGPAAVVGIEAVVHLAGEPIFGGAPTKARLARVRESRVASTHRLVERIAALPEGARPRTFVCASAVGYYGDRGEERLDESSSAGSGTLAEICRDWEAEASRAEALVGVRVVRLRIGVVLAREGGALSLMKIPFSLGVGGRLGSGRQFFPWIHIDDLVGAIVFALEQESLRGPVNAVAPSPVRNVELTQTLGRVLGRPTVLPVPGFALRAALGPLADELLGSRCVVPRRLEEAGFAFRHPALEEALAAELDR
jgi:uncharacterized protein (TIGR01777 family)